MVWRQSIKKERKILYFKTCVMLTKKDLLEAIEDINEYGRKYEQS